MSELQNTESLTVSKARTAMEKTTTVLTKTGEALSKQITDMTLAISGLSADIETKSDELASLDAQVALKRAEAGNELRIALLGDKMGTVQDILEAEGYAFITKNEINEIVLARNEATIQLQDFTRTDTDEVNAKVQSAVKAAVNSQKQEFDVVLVGKEGEIAALNREVIYLTETVADLKAEAKAEREARVKISENQAVNYNVAAKQ